MDLKSRIEMLERVIDSVPGHVYWKDLNGVHLGCNINNAKAANLMQSKDIIGKTDYELSWKDRADQITASDKLVIEQQTEVITEDVIILPGKKRETTFLTQKMPLYDNNGKIIGIVGVSVNISELKETQKQLEIALNKAHAAEQEQEKVLAKYQDFVSNQEHDIRTPVASVMGLATALIDMLSDPAQLEVAKLLYESAKAQKAYQNSLLDSIYLFENETETYQRRFEVRSVFERVKSIYACTFKEKNLSFTLEIDDQLPHFLWGDWFRVQQILICLLSNSVKFTNPNDKIWLRCKALPKSTDKIVLSIQLEDTGIGIAEDKQNTIFEPFTRLSLSNLGKYSGRGLGLTFVKKMVGELNGEITLKSTLEKGSVFHILLPFDLSLSDEPTPEPQGK